MEEFPIKARMTVEQLMEALKNLNPKAEIKINIRQSNKSYGVIQLPINSKYTTALERDLTSDDFNVDNSYGGSITVYLPDGAYIAKLPK